MTKLETHQAPEYLHKFFNKLVDLKSFIKEKYDETQDPILKEIYDKFDACFLSTKETK